MMKNLFFSIYNGKTVIITGNTGFKGSWLSLWLKELGANVVGYSLEPSTKPSNFELLSLEYKTIFSDIRDRERLFETFKIFQPDIIFHLAAQPLVRYSYQNPIETFETNVLGTVNVLEACRNTSSVKAIINITSDKCYENREWVWGYRESDPMGGYDPYSASKGCAEIVTSSYRNSFFNNERYGETHNTLLASVRAGNVIGGGDWAQDRIVPDIMKAASRIEPVEIRSPNAKRSWLHVLDSLSGYLWLGYNLLAGKKNFAEAWNFGPSNNEIKTVQEVVNIMKKSWEKINYIIKHQNNNYHEADLLSLDISKAQALLRWNPVWNNQNAIEKTVLWYRDYYENKKSLMLEHSLQDLYDYSKTAQARNILWSLNQE